MLTELRVRQLGLIEDLQLVLGPGMTALTGETGAGKTLLVEAILLLLGGRADPVLVRPGASEALVEGRFTSTGPDGSEAGVDASEVILARSLPTAGRSRAYVDGRMAPLGTLAAAGAELVDVHGQHAHQSLLDPTAQRRALDRFGGVDLGEVVSARRRLAEIDRALGALGGDARARARELDLLRYQIDELDGAAIEDPDEDERLAQEEEVLADALAHREAAALAYQALSGEDADPTQQAGALHMVGRAAGALSGRAPFSELARRLRAVEADLDDLAQEARKAVETLEEDPARLEWIRTRRQFLRELVRKYGEDLAGVLVFAEQVRSRLEEVASHDQRAEALEAERRVALGELRAAEQVVAAARRAAAPALGQAIAERLHELAMPRASFEVAVGDDDAGSDVRWLLSANAGEPLRPLSKVASGGELARTMLAARLVVGGDELGGEGPRTLIFDEVDAGIGGEAALAVGRALAQVAGDHQVLVVTHLAQVAAFADQQIGVAKREVGGRTVATAAALASAERVVELSRMLSGQPDSATARRHALELLATAQADSARSTRRGS